MELIKTQRIPTEKADAHRLAHMLARLLNHTPVTDPLVIVEDAVALGRAAVTLDPNSGEAWNALSAAYNQIPGREREQAAAAREAAKLSPNDPTAWHNLSIGLMRTFQFEAALDAAVKATSIPAPENPFLWMQAAFMAGLLEKHELALSMLDYARDMLNEGHAQYREFIAEIEISRAIAYAKLGDWGGFFAAIDKRHEYAMHPTMVSELWKARKLWNQQARRSHALVYLEWGIGDQIQFARMVPALHRKYKSVTVACSQELMRLMQTLRGVDRVIAHDDLNWAAVPDTYSVYPVIDLMREDFQAGRFALGPFDEPYLKVKEFGVPWDVPAAADDRRIRVAFGWQGDRRQPQDFSRRVPFTAFAAFAAAHPDRYHFVSLQTKFAGYCDPWEGWPADVPVTDCSEFITDMASTAELMARCDVFVGQCGALLHLAGALGKPAVAMLGASHDWRWDFEPLYGENFALLFQDRPGDWPSAFGRLDAAIDKVLNRLPAATLERMA